MFNPWAACCGPRAPQSHRSHPSIIEHLDFQQLTRVLNPAGRIDHSFDDVHLVENGERTVTRGRGSGNASRAVGHPRWRMYS